MPLSCSLLRTMFRVFVFVYKFKLACVMGPMAATSSDAPCTEEAAAHAVVSTDKPAITQPLPTTEQCRATLVPHAGLVYVDCVADMTWILTHTITAERVQLPRGSWELIEEEDSGFAALMQTNVDPPVITNVEDMLKLTLCTREGSEGYHILEVLAGGKRKIYSLDEERCRHKEGKASVRIGHTTAEAGLSVFVFVRPRTANSRMYWSASDIYRFLGMDSYKSCPSQWSWRSAPKWRKMMAQQPEELAN